MRNRWFLYTLSLGFLSFACAQQPEDILEKAAKAQLGSSNPSEIFSVHIKGTMSMPQGIMGEFEIFQKEGGKFYQKTTIPSMSLEVVQGCDGTDCYNIDPMLGPRLLSGQELANTLLEADFQSEFNWKETFKSYQYAGEADVNGKPCYKLNLITKAGLEITNYYDKETSLLKQTDTVIETEVMGKVSGKMYYDHYEEFEGILMPTQMIMEMISNRIEMNKSTFEFNQKMDDAMFVIPASVRTAPASK